MRDTHNPLKDNQTNKIVMLQDSERISKVLVFVVSSGRLTFRRQLVSQILSWLMGLCKPSKQL